MKRVFIILIVCITAKILYLLYASFSGYDADINVFIRNDSYWYETIATHGHSKITPDQLGSCEENELKQSYYAFFPLYPVIIGSTMEITGISFALVALFYSLLFSIALFLLFYKFIGRLFDSEPIAFYSTLVLILFPFHYYFSMFYTESLFLLILIASFYALLLDRMLLFSIFSALLVLVRPNGLFMLVPLFIFFAERHQNVRLSNLVNVSLKQYRLFHYFAIPVLVFVCYCGYLKIMTGDFFAYKTAQAGWCRETVMPWTPIIRSSNWMDYVSSIYLLGFMAIAAMNFKKIPLSFSALIWINLLLPLTASSITSPRFISIVFVFSLLFGKVMCNNRNTVNIVVFIIFFILQLVTFHFWLIGSKFSY